MGTYSRGLTESYSKVVFIRKKKIEAPHSVSVLQPSLGVELFVYIKGLFIQKKKGIRHYIKGAWSV